MTNTVKLLQQEIISIVKDPTLLTTCRLESQDDSSKKLFEEFLSLLVRTIDEHQLKKIVYALIPLAKEDFFDVKYTYKPKKQSCPDELRRYAELGNEGEKAEYFTGGLNMHQLFNDRLNTQGTTQENLNTALYVLSAYAAHDKTFARDINFAGCPNEDILVKHGTFNWPDDNLRREKGPITVELSFCYYAEVNYSSFVLRKVPAAFDSLLKDMQDAQLIMIKLQDMQAENPDDPSIEGLLSASRLLPRHGINRFPISR